MRYAFGNVMGRLEELRDVRFADGDDALFGALKETQIFLGRHVKDFYNVLLRLEKIGKRGLCSGELGFEILNAFHLHE